MNKPTMRMNRLKLGLFMLSLFLIGLNSKTYAQNQLDEICPTGLFKVSNAITEADSAYSQFIKYPGTHGLFFSNLNGQDTHFFFEEGTTLATSDVGGGILQGKGTFENSPFTDANGTCTWEVTFVLEPFENGEAKIETTGDFQTSVDDDWVYWIVSSGTAIPLDENDNPKADANTFSFGAVKGGNGPYQVQIGQNANGKNDSFGASSWFDWTFSNANQEVLASGQGDFNVDLECTEDPTRIFSFCPEITPEENGDYILPVSSAITTDADLPNVKYPSPIGSTHSIYLENYFGNGQPARLNFLNDAILTDKAEGGLVLEGTAESADNGLENKIFHVTVNLEDNPVGIPKNETTFGGEDFQDLIEDWTYYQITDGTITCTVNGQPQGQILIQPSASQFQTQIGAAANGKNGNLGLSSWLQYKENISSNGNEFTSFKKGDINIDIECPDDPTRIFSFCPEITPEENGDYILPVSSAITTDADLPNVKYPSPIGSTHSIFLANYFGNGQPARLNFLNDAILTDKAEGGLVLEGTAESTDNGLENKIFHITVNLEDNPVGIPKNETTFGGEDFQDLIEDWTYYQITDGTITCTVNGQPQGQILIQPSASQFQTQIGAAANGKNGNLGLSSWLQYKENISSGGNEFTAFKKGDINIDIECPEDRSRIFTFCPDISQEENGDYILPVKNAVTSNADLPNVKYPSLIGNDHSIYLANYFGNGQTARLTFHEGATLTDKAEGGLVLEGTAESTDNGLFQKVFQVSIHFEEDANGIPKNETTFGGEDFQDLIEDWTYYRITEGTITCTLNGEPQGQILIEPSASQFQAQIGDAANGKNGNLGLSSWLQYKENISSGGNEFTSFKNGDINIDIECPVDRTEFVQATSNGSCVNDNNGQIGVNISAGAPNFKIFYQQMGSEDTPLMIETSEPNAVLIDLPIGNYTVKVKDNEGTQTSFTQMISEDDESCTPSIFEEFCEDSTPVADISEGISLVVTNAVTQTVDDENKAKYPSIVPRSHGIYLSNFFQNGETSVLGGTVLRLSFLSEPSATITELNDGTYEIAGQMLSVDFLGEIFDASIILEQCDDCEFKNELTSQAEFDLLSADWSKLKIVEGIISNANLGEILISPNSSSTQAQIGFGANGKNCNYGLSSWFSYQESINTGSLSSVRKGDINIDISCPGQILLSETNTDDVCVDPDTNLGQITITTQASSSEYFIFYQSNEDNTPVQSFQTTQSTFVIPSLLFGEYNFAIFNAEGTPIPYTESVDESDPVCTDETDAMCYDYSMDLCAETSFTDLEDLTGFIYSLGQTTPANPEDLLMIPNPDMSNFEACDNDSASLDAQVFFCGFNWDLRVQFTHTDFSNYQSVDSLASDGQSVNRLVCTDCPPGADMTVYLTDVELTTCDEPLINTAKITFNWFAPNITQYSSDYPTSGTAGICTKLTPKFQSIISEECTDNVNGVLLQSVDPVLKTAIFNGDTQACTIDALGSVYVISDSLEINTKVYDKDFTFTTGGANICSVLGGQTCDWDNSNPNNQPLSQIELNVHPNPNKGVFKLNAVGSEGLIQVMNTEGKIIYESFFDSYLDEELDLSEYGNGMYLIRTVSPDGTSKVTRMLLSK